MHSTTYAPDDYLEKIDVEPSAKRNLILADGRQDTRLIKKSSRKRMPSTNAHEWGTNDYAFTIKNARKIYVFSRLLNHGELACDLG